MRLNLPLVTLLATLPLVAQQPTATPRFAVFIPEQVLQQSNRAKKIFTDLDAANGRLREKLKAKADELQKLEQQAKSPGISDEGRAKLEREFQDSQLAFKRTQEDSEKEYAVIRERVFGQFQQEIKPILDALAKEWKLDVVIQNQPGLFIPVDETWLMTFSNEMAKRYDAQYATEAASEKPAAKPATTPKAKPATKPTK